MCVAWEYMCYPDQFVLVCLLTVKPRNEIDEMPTALNTLLKIGPKQVQPLIPEPRHVFFGFLQICKIFSSRCHTFDPGLRKDICAVVVSGFSQIW